MNRKKLLFAGFGDIAQRLNKKLTAAGWETTGIARSDRVVPEGTRYWRGSLQSNEIMQRIAAETFAVVVVTLTPDGRQDEDYHRAYVETSRCLIDTLGGNSQPPSLVIYVSSTGVYHQTDGSWVDERSETRPQIASGRRLLEAENLWRESGLSHTIVRFAGIYGGGRQHLLRQVIAGKGGPKNDAPFTNRIHVDDCTGVIEFLLDRHVAGEDLERLYLASDKQPATSWEVREWLAHALGYGPNHLKETSASGRGGNKRCSNARLLSSGYRFQYPDYRSGYSELLQSR